MPIRLTKPKPKPYVANADAFALVEELDAWGRATFRIPHGISKGQPFRIQEFQKPFLVALLSQDPDGPTYRNLIYSLPRKLGKSMLLAFICPGSHAIICRNVAHLHDAICSCLHDAYTRFSETIKVP